MRANHKVASGKRTRLTNESSVTSVAGWKCMLNWIIVLATVTPFLFSTTTMDPVLTVRYIFLGWFAMCFLLFFFAVKKTTTAATFKGLLRTFFLLSIGYGLWSMLCSLFAVNPSESVYETARYLLNIVLLFCIIISIRQQPELILRLCKALTIAALLHSSIGVLQYFDLAFRDIPGGAAANPNDPNPAWPHGLMANRNLFGSAQVLLLPFILFVLYRANSKWKYVAITVLAGTLVSILISQTRSAWLSSFALLLSAAVAVLIFSPSRWKKWAVRFLAGGTALGLILLLNFTVSPESKLSESIKMRAASLLKPSIENTTSSGRLVTWNKSLQLIRDHAIKGVGPGNWKLAITAYGGSGTGWASGLVLPSQPHNVYIQLASETGIPGAVLYFGMWLLLWIAAVRVIKKSSSQDTRVLNILMLAGSVAFAVDSFFSFPTQRIEHSLYAILMAGITLESYARLDDNQQKPMRINRWGPVAMVAIIAFNIFLGYQRYRFEEYVNTAKRCRLERRFEEVIKEVKAGQNKWVTLDPAGEPLEMQSAAAYVELKEYDKALIEILTAQKHNPGNARIFTTMGVIHANLKADNEAIRCYQRALQLAPEYEVALKNLAGLYFINGNYAACIQTIEKMKSRSYRYITDLYNEAKKRLETNPH